MTYSYTNTRYGRFGAMVCTVCKKEISEGPYRYQETDAAFLVQHRACSRDDEQWAKNDLIEADVRLTYEKKLQAYREFRDNWSEGALDGEIQNIEEFLKRISSEAISDIKFN